MTTKYIFLCDQWDDGAPAKGGQWARYLPVPSPVSQVAALSMGYFRVAEFAAELRIQPSCAERAVPGEIWVRAAAELVKQAISQRVIPNSGSRFAFCRSVMPNFSSRFAFCRSVQYTMPNFSSRFAFCKSDWRNFAGFDGICQN